MKETRVYQMRLLLENLKEFSERKKNKCLKAIELD
jgi:hypothetical protein